MSEKRCKGCSSPVPANRRHCAHCGLRTGIVGPGVATLFIVSAAVAVLLIQDYKDRSNSWVRQPLRARREQTAGLPSAATSFESTPAERTARPRGRTHRTDTRHFTEIPRQSADSPVAATPVDEPASAPQPPPATDPQPSNARASAPLSREEQWTADFKPPEIGSAVTVRLRGGKDMSGTLLALDETQLEIETPSLTIALSPSQLAAATRVRFFLADYLRYRELRAARERDSVAARTPASPPREAAEANPSESDDPFLRSEEGEESQATPSSRRSPTADAFMKAF